MKDYIFLEWSKFNDYRSMNDLVVFSKLQYLVNLFSGNYNLYDTNIFTQALSFYDANFVYNDLKNKMFYIGTFEDNEKNKISNIEFFLNYLNETNNCKISHKNFTDLVENLIIIKRNPAPFVIIYSTESNRIYFKAFRFKEDMELFDQNVFQQFPIMRKEIHEIFLQIQACADAKQAENYFFGRLENIHSVLCQLRFIEEIELPDDLDNFIRDFDNIGDSWSHEYLFNKIKAGTYSL